jgi:hypothetical protein
MSGQAKNADNLPTTPMSILEVLRSGQILAKNLNKDQRQVCVEYLINQGYPTAEIAEILKVCTRTVRRYKEQIRKSNAIELDTNFTAEHVGWAFQNAQYSIDYLKRLAKKTDCPHFSRVKSVNLT